MKRCWMTFIFMVFCMSLLEGQVKTSVLTADFAGMNKDRVYDIYTRTDYITTVVLPQNVSARHVVCGDIPSWQLKSDGKFVFVKPLRRSILTSLTIVSENNRVYVFNLVEDSGKRGLQAYEVMAMVKIRDESGDLFVKLEDNRKAAKPSTGLLREEAKRSSFFHPGLNYRYKVKKNRFSVERVGDDGIFTYLYMPKGRVRPAVFIKRGKRREPVKFLDRGDCVVVHRVLGKGEKLLLVLGKRVSKIARKG